MPWSIEKRGDEYCVVKDGTGETEGCHPSRQKARDQMAALYASEDKQVEDRSMYDKANDVIDAFRARFPAVNAWVEDVFDDAIIAGGEGQYFRIPYTRSEDGEIAFGMVSEWVEVRRNTQWEEIKDGLSVAGLDDVSRQNVEGEFLLVAPAGAVKALGDGRVGGYLVTFSGPDAPDLEGDFFTSETDFDVPEAGKSTSIYYGHGLDPVIKRRRIGHGQLKVDDVGVWVEGQLAMRDEYEKAIYEMAEAGKLGWSSGTAPNLVERKMVGDAFHIKSWPLGLDASLTPIPAEPRNVVLSLKKWREAYKEFVELHPEGAGDAPAVFPLNQQQIAQVAALTATVVNAARKGEL